MINVDDVAKENIKEHKPNWPQIPDHPYRTLTIGGFWPWKTSSLFNVISHQLDSDKICLYAKDPCEAKYQLLIKKQEIIGLKHLNGSKAFFEYSNDTGDIYENIEEYNPNKKDMTTDILCNKKLNPLA